MTDILMKDPDMPQFGLSFYDLVAQAILDKRVTKLKMMDLFPHGDRSEFMKVTGKPTMEGQWLWVTNGKSTLAERYSAELHQQTKWNLRRLRDTEQEFVWDGATIQVKEEGRDPFFPWIGIPGSMVLGMVKVESHKKIVADTLTFGEVKFLETPIQAVTSLGLWQVNNEFLSIVNVVEEKPEWLDSDGVFNDPSAEAWFNAELASKIIEGELVRGQQIEAVIISSVLSIFRDKKNLPEIQMRLLIRKLCTLWSGKELLQKHRNFLIAEGYDIPSHVELHSQGAMVQ